MFRDYRKRIVLIDDHPIVRQGLERLLSSGDEFVVIDEAGSALDALDAVRETLPDAVVVDIELPDFDGIELTRRLLHEFPSLVVVVLSAHEEAEFAARALAAGAMAYVAKNEAIEKLRMALTNAFLGKRTFAAA